MDLPTPIFYAGVRLPYLLVSPEVLDKEIGRSIVKPTVISPHMQEVMAERSIKSIT